MAPEWSRSPYRPLSPLPVARPLFTVSSSPSLSPPELRLLPATHCACAPFSRMRLYCPRADFHCACVLASWIFKKRLLAFSPRARVFQINSVHVGVHKVVNECSPWLLDSIVCLKTATINKLIKFKSQIRFAVLFTYVYSTVQKCQAPNFYMYLGLCVFSVCILWSLIHSFRIIQNKISHTYQVSRFGLESPVI